MLSRVEPIARRSARLSVLLLLAATACDMPTKLPSWDQTWLIPGDSTTVGVSELLPATGEVSIATLNGQQVFSVNVASPGTFSRSLGQICSACAAVNGTTVPKPAFTLNDSTGTTLPASLVAATVVSGGFTYTITNGFSFDPIRPNAAGAPYGYFVLLVMNGSTVVAEDSINGASLAMGKNGATLQRNVALNLGGGSLSITGSKPLEVYLMLNSPSGDPVTINTNQTLSVSIVASPISASQAQVNVTNQNVNAAQTTIDLSSVSDPSLVNRVQGATLHLNIASPFGVQGTLTATFSVSGAQPIVKSIPLTTAAQQSPDVTLSAAEIRALLGHTANLSVSGTVSAPSGSVTITPTQVLKVNSTFEIILSTTES